MQNYDKARFNHVVLRPETEERLKQNPQGQQLARLNKLLLEDASAGLAKSALTGWIVRTVQSPAPAPAAGSSTRRRITAVIE
jgi:hypothetical protein